jgi:hypothetical protein
MSLLLETTTFFQKVPKKEQLGDILDGICERCIDASSPPPEVFGSDSESKGKRVSVADPDSDLNA